MKKAHFPLISSNSLFVHNFDRCCLNIEYSDSLERSFENNFFPRMYFKDVMSPSYLNSLGYKYKKSRKYLKKNKNKHKQSDFVIETFF